MLVYIHGILCFARFFFSCRRFYGTPISVYERIRRYLGSHLWIVYCLSFLKYKYTRVRDYCIFFNYYIFHEINNLLWQCFQYIEADIALVLGSKRWRPCCAAETMYVRLRVHAEACENTGMKIITICNEHVSKNNLNINKSPVLYCNQCA